MPEEMETIQNSTADHNEQGTKHKSRKDNEAKKKKRRTIGIYNIALILLVAIMLFSGYQVVSKLIEYRQADVMYADLGKDVVQVLDGPPVFTKAAETLPSVPESTIPTITEQAVPGTLPEGKSVPATQPAATKENVPEETTAPPLPTEPPVTYPAPQGNLPWLAINFDALKAKNEDVIGWLYGQNGEINLPIAQGTNNSYYLHRLLDGTWNFAGTLFADYRNHFLEDDVTIIYGHKMRNKTMFGKLDQYDSYNYYLENPVLRLYMPTAIYELQIVASVYTDTQEKIILNFDSEAAFNEAVASYQKRAQYDTGVTVEYGDKLICLYTCAYQVEDGRRYMICKLVQIA